MSHVAPPSEPQPVLPVLEYGNPVDRQLPPPAPLAIRVVFFVFSLAAAASPFLPFTFSTSPLDVWRAFVVDTTWDGRLGTFDRELMTIATPFFLGPLLAMCHLWQLFRPAWGRGARITVVVIGLVGVALTVTFVAPALVSDDLGAGEVGQIMLAPATLVVGGGLFVGLRRRHLREDAAAVALATGYACNAVVLLAAMYSPTHVGWWVTLVATCGIAAGWAYLSVRVVRAGR